MKNRIVSLLLFLCFVFSAFALASCDRGGEETDAATAEATEPVASDTVENTENPLAEKWEKIAPKVTMMAESARSLRIECSSNVSAEKASKNDVYLKGPDAVVDGETPKIEQMVYERNKAARDLLHLSTEFVFWNESWGKQADKIDLAVKGKAADAPDLFVNMLNELNLELLNGTFKDVWTIQGSFFDFKTVGWLEEWMKTLSFTGDRGYILGSDYFLDVFRAVPVLPFNMTMMDASADKLAGAILEEGETLGQGERLTPRFFDLVERGEWTWDVLGKLCEAIWEDTDNDGQDSIFDQLGIIGDEYGDGGQCAGSFIYSCGETLTEVYRIEDESSPNYNKQWIKYNDTSDGLNLIFEKVKTVFEGPGSLSTSFDFSGNTPANPGIAYHHTKFASGDLLFTGVCLLGGLEDEVFQNMDDLYSVVPCPKTDVSNEYNTIIYSTGDAGAINVNVKPPKAKALTAYLQYCTENSPPIRSQFLQIVMKYNVTTYDQGTDRMLDIIYDAIRYGRDKTVDDLVGNSGNRWHGLMRHEHFLGGADFISRQYEANRSVKQKVLDERLKTWYTLPKAEN